MDSSESQFDASFRDQLRALLASRRDVRHFRPDPLPTGMVKDLLQIAGLAPSVGFSQPWRWVLVDAPERRAAIVANFQTCNELALKDFEGTRASLYARLKLAGLIEAPTHLAVLVDPETKAGHGLGLKSMPEMLSYSAVCAVHTLWLAARAHSIGLGWVSILDPVQVHTTLDLPASWKLLAYLCLGYPREERDRPELETEGWEAHRPDWNCPLQR